MTPTILSTKNCEWPKSRSGTTWINYPMSTPVRDNSSRLFCTIQQLPTTRLVLTSKLSGQVPPATVRTSVHTVLFTVTGFHRLSSLDVVTPHFHLVNTFHNSMPTHIDNPIAHKRSLQDAHVKAYWLEQGRLALQSKVLCRDLMKCHASR